jgi:hypothetical protein
MGRRPSALVQLQPCPANTVCKQQKAGSVADETPDGGFVGEDADDLDAPLDLAVQPFDRIGGVQLSPDARLESS